MAFDTLEFANALEKGGLEREQAQAHAQALKDHVMPELATKSDIVEVKHLISMESLKLTVAMGGMIALGVSLIIAAQRLF
jgi:hypothetical protein